MYFCKPFRDKVLGYKAQPKKKENLLTCLSDLFNNITTQKKKVGVIAPKKFIGRLRKENGRSVRWVFFFSRNIFSFGLNKDKLMRVELEPMSFGIKDSGHYW